MRVFVWLVIVLALIGGALYGVGYFLLPNALDVSRSVQIARPRAAVFAMSNDLKIVKEWSPFYARDPNAQFTFSGEGPGPGQAMNWASNTRDVGNGRMTIVRSQANREIDTILQLGERATLNGRLTIQRTEQGSAVMWKVSAECTTGPINVPCRYMNLVLRRSIETELDQGLARLKSFAEQLPNVDFEGLRPEFVQVPAMPFVFVEASTSSHQQSEVDRAVQLAIGQVQKYMTDYTLSPAGPLLRVTTSWNASEQRMSFRVGYPFDGPAPLTIVGVQIAQTPSGAAMKVTHVGPRATVQDTYAAAYAYLQAHRIPLREEGLPWEVVRDDGMEDPNNANIDIYIPLQ